MEIRIGISYTMFQSRIRTKAMTFQLRGVLTLDEDRFDLTREVRGETMELWLQRNDLLRFWPSYTARPEADQSHYTCVVLSEGNVKELVNANANASANANAPLRNRIESVEAWIESLKENGRMPDGQFTINLDGNPYNPYVN